MVQQFNGVLVPPQGLRAPIWRIGLSCSVGTEAPTLGLSSQSWIWTDCRQDPSPLFSTAPRCLSLVSHPQRVREKRQEEHSPLGSFICKTCQRASGSPGRRGVRVTVTCPSSWTITDEASTVLLGPSSPTSIPHTQVGSCNGPGQSAQALLTLW